MEEYDRTVDEWSVSSPAVCVCYYGLPYHDGVLQADVFPLALLHGDARGLHTPEDQLPLPTRLPLSLPLPLPLLLALPIPLRAQLLSLLVLLRVEVLRQDLLQPRLTGQLDQANSCTRQFYLLLFKNTHMYGIMLMLHLDIHLKMRTTCDFDNVLNRTFFLIRLLCIMATIKYYFFKL